MSSSGVDLSAPRGAIAVPRVSWLAWMGRYPPQLLLGAVVLAAIVLVTFVGPLIYRTSPYTLNPAVALTPPSAQALPSSSTRSAWPTPAPGWATFRTSSRAGCASA